MGYSRRDIARYYDTHQFLYSRFWSAHALHYGFWYHDTKNLAEAVLNTNRFVVDTLEIDSGDMVLDSGCGVGGTSLYTAEATGARVAGITLSLVQLGRARERAAQSPARDLLHFSGQDYLHTAFSSGTFTKVFAVESVCHAHSKADFLAEAFRIMAPGGRIVIIDAFLAAESLSPAEEWIYNKVREGWVIPNLCSMAQFHTLLRDAGFNDPRFCDMQQYVEKSVRRIHHCSLLTAPVNFLKSKLGKMPKNLAAKYQRRLFERHIATYGVFVAQKPGSLAESSSGGGTLTPSRPMRELAVNERLGHHKQNGDPDR